MSASASPPSLVSRVFSAHAEPHYGNVNRSLLFVGTSKPSTVVLRAAPPPRSSTVVFSRRKKRSSETAKTGSSKFKKSQRNNLEGEDDINEDAIEALFSQLEEDLKNDKFDDDGDDEISEEDLARLEEELEEALGDGDYDEISGGLQLNSESMDDDDDESDEEEEPPKLKNWQVRRLAHALKIGRRKTSIKSLAAELGLDRAFVLELLRDPPPQLLMMSASLPDKVTETPEMVCASLHDKVTETPAEPQIKLTEEVPPLTNVTNVEESKPEVQAPVHVMRTRWSMQKRLKKVQVQTLERVYSRTKRPTNAMISSIVHVTNLPSKRVVKWFEEKRMEDGVPEHRVPFRPPTPGILTAGST